MKMLTENLCLRSYRQSDDEVKKSKQDCVMILRPFDRTRDRLLSPV